MRRFFTIGIVAAGLGLLGVPWALADDQSGSDQGSGSNSGQMSSGQYSSDQMSDQGRKEGQNLSEQGRKDISGHNISDQENMSDQERQGGFGATTTRPSGESAQGQREYRETERREYRETERTSREREEAPKNVRNYSVRDLESLSPDARFLVTDYESNLFEIQAGKLVADRSRNDEIRRFARNIVDDHRRANDKIRDLADRMNVALPDRVAPWQQAMLDHMSQLNDRDLGRKFVFHQVGMHNVNILEHQWVANHTRNRDIGQLAERMTSGLEHHLEIACGLATRLSEAAEGQARASE